ncbi:MAG: DoxX family protein [Armatimonadota bacterium]|nr:DoxX family protein [Armatimonadota bacterium]
MDVLFLIGRIILGAFFILNGLFHFMRLDAMSQYASYKGVPAPKAAVAITGLMLLAGGLSILLGYKVTIGAWLLIIFLVPTAFIMHNFWTEKDPMSQGNQMAHFLKNLALAAAALLVTFIPNWPFSIAP